MGIENVEKPAEQPQLKEGDFFTVVRWTSHHDNSFRGDCLEAKLINHPFVRTFLHDGNLRGRTITLNLEQVEIMRLTDGFVQNVIGGYTDKKPVSQTQSE